MRSFVGNVCRTDRIYDGTYHRPKLNLGLLSGLCARKSNILLYRDQSHCSKLILTIYLKKIHFYLKLYFHSPKHSARFGVINF